MSFFGELYLRSTRPVLSDEMTRQEASFIARTLELRPNVRTLDIGCGHGRHLAELAGGGLDAWGIDSDPLSLRSIPARHRHRAVRADFYALPFKAAFEAAYAWYATLFISDAEEENRAALREAASALRPGGRLLVHGHNPVVQRQEAEHRFETTLPDGTHLVEETWYDLATDVLHGQRWLERGGERLEGQFVVRCPRADDHARWALAAGLRIDAIFGDVSGEPFSATSPDLIVRYRKA